MAAPLVPARGFPRRSGSNRAPSTSSSGAQFLCRVITSSAYASSAARWRFMSRPAAPGANDKNPVN